MDLNLIQDFSSRANPIILFNNKSFKKSHLPHACQLAHDEFAFVITKPLFDGSSSRSDVRHMQEEECVIIQLIHRNRKTHTYTQRQHELNSFNTQLQELATLWNG